MEGPTVSSSAARRPAARHARGRRAGAVLGRLRSALAVSRHPVLRRFWVSQVVSEAGDWIGLLGVAALLYQRTGQAVFAAAAVTAVYLPYLLSPLLAGMAARLPPKTLLVSTDLFRAAVVAAMLIPGLPVWAILGLVFLAALPASYYESTTSAVVPEYAPDEGTRDDALVLFQSTQQAANMVGFLTGGALLAVLGVPAALAANALSYLVAAALLSGIPRLAALADEDETSLGLAVQGIRAIARQPLLRGAVLITVVTASTIMAGEALVIVIADAVDHPGWAGAMAATTAAIAALLGLLLPRHRPSHELLRLSALVMASGLALAMVVFAGLNGAWGAFVGFVALGLVSAPAALTYVVAIRELTPANRASVFALVQVALMGGQALVAVLAGWLADQLSVGAAVALLQVPALGLVLWVAAESHVPERGLASPSDDQRVVPEAEPVDPELLGAATAEPVSDCEPSGAISAEDAESAPR